MKREKAIQPAAKYLSMVGYEVLFESDDGSLPDIVAKDEDGMLVFIEADSIEIDEGIPEVGGYDRAQHEIGAAYWLTTHDADADVRIRFDHVLIIRLNDDRAMVRHVKNIFGGSE